MKYPIVNSEKTLVNGESINVSDKIEIQLPTFIDAVVGDTIQIFYQALTSSVRYDNFSFLVYDPSNLSKSFDRYFEYTPLVDSERVLTFYILDVDGVVLDQKTTTIRAKTAVASPLTPQYVWNIGDSLTANNVWPDEWVRRLTGTGGSPVGNEFTNITMHIEGNSGKEWNWYVNNEASPFVYSGVVDFEQYRIDNGLDVPTVAQILLTWNGVWIQRTDAEWDTWSEDVYTFLDKFKLAFPSVDVKLMSPQMPSTNGGLGTNYGAQGLNSAANESLLKINCLRMAKIYDDISNELGYEYVEHIQTALQVDSVNNMITTPKALNTRNPTTEDFGLNGVHPADIGSWQFADAAYRNFINNYCQG
jgi:hypothetical protein